MRARAGAIEWKVGNEKEWSKGHKHDIPLPIKTIYVSSWFPYT